MARDVPIFTIGAALVLAASQHLGRPIDDDILRVDDWPEPRKPRLMQEVFRGRAPNDHGPVIDTTPESKRAKRRRLARAALSKAEDRDHV